MAGGVGLWSLFDTDMNLPFTHWTCFVLLCCFAGAPNTTATGKVIKDVEFAVVQGQSLKLDLYLPDKPKGSGLVVWIHRGQYFLPLERGSQVSCPTA